VVILQLAEELDRLTLAVALRLLRCEELIELVVE
jgi:hypothetical protein